MPIHLHTIIYILYIFTYCFLAVTAESNSCDKHWPKSLKYLLSDLYRKICLPLDQINTYATLSSENSILQDSINGMVSF